MSLADTPENKWHNRIASSGVLDQIDAAQIAAERVAALPPSEQADLQRVRAILSATKGRLDLLDPETVSEGLLAELGSSVANVHSALVQLADTQNVAYLANAMAPAENVINLAARLFSPAGLDEAGKTVTSFKQSVAGTKSQVVRQLEEALASVETAKQNALVDVASLTEQVAALRSQLATIESESTTANANAATTFQQAEAERSTLFGAHVDAQVTESKAAIQTQVTEFTRVIAEAQEKMSSSVTAAKASNDRIDSILDLVGEKGLVGEYAKSADRERKATFWWRIGAGVVALIAVGISVAALKTPVDGGWQRHYIPKLVVSVLLGGVAGYLANIAADHRRAALRNERVGLQLAAVKPYLGDLEDDTIRDALLAVLATQIFSADPTNAEAGKTIDPTAGGQLTDLLTKVLREAMDRASK